MVAVSSKLLLLAFLVEDPILRYEYHSLYRYILHLAASFSFVSLFIFSRCLVPEEGHPCQVYKVLLYRLCV